MSARIGLSEKVNASFEIQTSDVPRSACSTLLFVEVVVSETRLVKLLKCDL